MENVMKGLGRSMYILGIKCRNYWQRFYSA